MESDNDYIYIDDSFIDLTNFLEIMEIIIKQKYLNWIFILKSLTWFKPLGKG